MLHFSVRKREKEKNIIIIFNKILCMFDNMMSVKDLVWYNDYTYVRYKIV